MKISITNNFDLCKEEFEAAVLRGLEAAGMVAETQAKLLVTSKVGSTTGNLRNSISHKVDPAEKTMYVGSDVHYAPYVEMGTGKYYPGGRAGWWPYVPGEEAPEGSSSGKTYSREEALRIMWALRAQGKEAYITNGQEAKPFIKPAIAEDPEMYKNIIEDELKG